jgi:hypothetical protein
MNNQQATRVHIGGYTFFSNEYTLPGQVRVNGELLQRKVAEDKFRQLRAQGLKFGVEHLEFTHECDRKGYGVSGWGLDWRDLH